MKLRTLWALLLWLSLHGCSLFEADSSFQGLRRLDPPPVELETARAHAAWVEVDGNSFWMSKSQPSPLWDIDGDGAFDFYVRRPDESGGGVVEVFSAKRGEGLRSYVYKADERISIQPLHDVDGDGGADYLLSDARGNRESRGLESIAGLRVISGRTGNDLVARSWSEFGWTAPVFGAFEVIDSESVGEATPLILIGTKALKKRPRMRRALLDPATLEPERYVTWETTTSTGARHSFWIDWGSDGVSDRVYFSQDRIDIYSSRNGSIIHSVELNSRRRLHRGWSRGGTSFESDWETRPEHAAIIGSQIVFNGPWDGEITAVGITSGHFEFRRDIAGPQIPFLHGFVPVLDVDGDGVTDLYTFCRRWDSELRGMRHEFLLFSGISGKAIGADSVK